MAIASITFPEPLERFYYFADDQVLTAGQLNQLAGHFDHENRLTRTKALGIGIVCGLEVEVSASGGEIRLTKGAAITSAGDLLQVSDVQRFRHIRKLQDEATVPTEDGTVRVRKLANERQPVPMWQLFTGSVDGSQPLTNTDGLPNFNDLVAVLYLDSWLKSPEECTDTNCDNAGVTQMNDLMVVLVPKQHLLPAENNPNRRRNLPKATVRNVDLAGGTLTNVQELINRYEAALINSLGSLTAAMEQIGKRFPSLVEQAFGNASPVQQWPVQLRTFATQFNNTPRIQYVYDFFQDLAASINELWEAITDIPGECCPAADRFAKYVMAGELVRGTGVRFSEYRHYFNEASILNEGARRAERAVFLLRRIGMMMRAFNPSQTLPTGAAAIRITPSKKGGGKLGDRAIPFYYQLNRTTPLHELWSFEKSQLGMEDTNHGYWMRNNSPHDDVQNPFNYTTDGSDFYRVEGLLGMNIEQAEREVERLQLVHNLGFKIETIQIEDDLPKVKPFRPIKFPDLNLFFRQNREELFSNLHLADHYVGSVKDEFDRTPDKSVFQNAKDPDGTDVLTNLTQAVNSDRNDFKGRVDAVTARMYKPMTQFHAEFTAFRKDYDEATTFAETIDRKVSYAKQSSVGSPIQKLVLENSSKRFELIADIFNKRKDFVLRQYIFDKFFNQNPGLRHQCGVVDGGTLVLAYSAVNQQVVADFCLPYCCVVELDDDDDNTPPPPITVRPLPGIIVKPTIPRPPFKWLDKLDLFQVPRIPKGVFDIEKLVVDKVNIASATYFETAFNTKVVTALPNIFQSGGGFTGGGLTVNPGLADLGRGIVDEDLKLDLDRAGKDAERLKHLNSIPPDKRSTGERSELERLTQELPARTRELIERAGAGNEDLAVGSDGAKALEGLAVLVEATKSFADFAPAVEVANNALSNSVSNSNFNKAGSLSKVLGSFRRTF